ncbi:MAG: glycosyltransferase family 4 protein [Gemmatimonadaceae bacterium]|nr:glycosyltransferase family 4 protein [Gemmatimonadaceae bacterium]
MKILINALTAREGGGITYVREMLPALARFGEAHEFHVLLSPEYQTGLLETLPEGIRPLIADVAAGQLLHRWWFEQVEIPRIIRRQSFDLLFTVNEIGTVRSPCPHVMLARNLHIHSPVPNQSTRQRLFLLWRRLSRGPTARAALRAADRVVFVSDAFRREVNASLALDPAKTHVVHHGVSLSFSESQNAEKDASSAGFQALPARQYLLAVSSIDVHKNFETLLLAYADAARAGADSFPDLVIAGTIADRPLYDRLQNRAKSLGISESVNFVGRVPHVELAALYHAALALVFPSRLESFGQPLLEAMASGAPIIASALPACREVCVDAALYFEPNDSTTLTTHITAIVTSRSLRARMRALGLERARAFSWEKTATRMMAIFEDAVASRRVQPSSQRGTREAHA